MALVGGGVGGASNTVNPAGTGGGLNYIGNHCYAFSGMFEATTSAQTMLQFTTANAYAIAKLTVSGAIDSATAGNGLSTVFVVSVNSEEVLRIKVDTDQEDSPTLEVVPLLLEPYSKIEVTSISNGDVAARKTSAALVGRVYA